MDETKEVLENIDKYRNIDNAEGKVLDKLGDKYGVKRGPADDEFYRMMIRSKIANRKGDTTVNGILRTMQNALGIDVKGVKIGPVYHDGVQEPLSLRLSNVPLSFARSEFEQEFMLRQIESIIAVGVRLQDLQFIVPISGNFGVGGGVATAYSFTLDDSKDYDFETHFKGISWVVLSIIHRLSPWMIVKTTDIELMVLTLVVQQVAMFQLLKPMIQKIMFIHLLVMYQLGQAQMAWPLLSLQTSLMQSSKSKIKLKLERVLIL